VLELEAFFFRTLIVSCAVVHFETETDCPVPGLTWSGLTVLYFVVLRFAANSIQ